MDYPVIFQIERIYYPVLAAVGITVNLVTIVILTRGKCGLSKCITRYLVGMANADLSLVIIDVILKRINSIYFPLNFLYITPICSLILVLYVAARDCSVWFTVAFTFDRFVAICCQKLKPKYCTEKAATVVLWTVCVVGCLRSIPFYFSYETSFIIDNVPWLCVTTDEYYTSHLWKAYEYIDSIVTPLLPIFLILLFNALTVRYIIAANRVRRGLRSNSENENDPEMENRRKSMILLFALSGNFILLWMTYVVHSLTWELKNYEYANRYYSNPVYFAQQIGFMLQLLSCSTNTCIYGLTLTKFREELKNGMKCLFTLNGKLLNLVAIVILSRGKCGLSKCITRYLVAMAAADLTVVIIDGIKWIP
ncbi:probable G-protein coupled receptor 139 [Heptranchias perlo]|uniref:probable G-protein coupled receptor 139 n=1 Tax=Heptranchias perlo TaxID=212740 RepID=UPI003559BF18